MEKSRFRPRKVYPVETMAVQFSQGERGGFLLSPTSLSKKQNYLKLVKFEIVTHRGGGGGMGGGGGCALAW